MSNVLIGIIGVILFIGLALAGALFLGPRFQEATSTSTASAAIQAVNQIAQAANLYEVQEGAQVGATQKNGINGVQTLIDGGYMKAVPAVPGQLGSIINDTVSTYAKGVPSPALNYALIAFPDDSKSEAMCRAVMRQTGLDASAPIPTDTMPSGRTGCIHFHADTGYGDTKAYMVWSALK